MIDIHRNQTGNRNQRDLADLSSVLRMTVVRKDENSWWARRLTEVIEYQQKTDTSKPLMLKAGDRDRTGDVQLGKSCRD